MSRRSKDERKCLVKEVHNPVDEAVVGSGTEGDGLREEETQRPRQRDGEERVQALLFVRVGLADTGCCCV